MATVENFKISWLHAVTLQLLFAQKTEIESNQLEINGWTFVCPKLATWTTEPIAATSLAIVNAKHRKQARLFH